MSDPVQALVKSIAGGKLQPVYVLYGEEPAAIKAVVTALRRALIPPDDAMAQSMAQAVALESVSAATDAHSPREHTPGGAPVDAPAESDLPLGAGPTLLITASHHPVLCQQ